MKRTQIYLDEKTYRDLKKESRLKGFTMSEITRVGVQTAGIYPFHRMVTQGITENPAQIIQAA